VLESSNCQNLQRDGLGGQSRIPKASSRRADRLAPHLGAYPLDNGVVGPLDGYLGPIRLRILDREPSQVR
jgi:hypothetical protein